MKKVLITAIAMSLMGAGSAMADSNYSPEFFLKDRASIQSGHNAFAIRDAQDNVRAYERLIEAQERGGSAMPALHKGYKGRR